MKALKHSQATFLVENLKLQGNFHSGIDEHTCTCSLYLINFHTALFQSYHYALPHLPHAEGCAYYMTRFDAYNVHVLILAKKKKFFIKYKYSVNYNICNRSITGTYYVDHIF